MAFQIFREYYPQLQKEALEAVQKLTEERLKMIPTENIVPPKANVVVPVLQNASLTKRLSIIRQYNHTFFQNRLILIRAIFSLFHLIQNIFIVFQRSI